MKEQTLMMISLHDRLAREVQRFNATRTPASKNTAIAGRLEANQQNLLKIIDNVEGMRKLFGRVAKEVRKVGDIGESFPSFGRVGQLVG